MADVAFKSREGTVLAGADGRGWFSNRTGSWVPVSGRVTVGDLDEEGFLEITDEKEVSRLVAEATSSSTEMPDGELRIVLFGRAMTERLEAVYGDILIWFRPGGFLQLEEKDWTVIDLWELSEGHSVTITNAREDLPDWFELHPTETSGSLAREMLKRLDEGYQPR